MLYTRALSGARTIPEVLDSYHTKQVWRLTVEMTKDKAQDIFDGELCDLLVFIDGNRWGGRNEGHDELEWQDSMCWKTEENQENYIV
jgi:hypothetical protein